MSLNGRSWFAWPSSGRVREQDGAAFKQPVSLHPAPAPQELHMQGPEFACPPQAVHMLIVLQCLPSVHAAEICAMRGSLICGCQR